MFNFKKLSRKLASPPIAHKPC